MKGRSVIRLSSSSAHLPVALAVQARHRQQYYLHPYQHCTLASELHCESESVIVQLLALPTLVLSLLDKRQRLRGGQRRLLE